MGEARGPNPRQVGRVVKGILVSGDQLLIFVVVVVVVSRRNKKLVNSDK